MTKKVSGHIKGIEKRVNERSPFQTTYHRNGWCTLWDVYTQQWVHTAHLSNRQSASLSEPERTKVLRHIARSTP